MHRHLNAVLTLAVLSMLVGCEPLATRLDMQPAGDVGGGHVLASVTTNSDSEAQFYLRALGAARETTLSSRAGGLFGPQTFRDGDAHGRVHALALPAGRYELTGWRLKLGREGHHQRWLQPAGLPPIEFALAAGEAVYLGNLHVQVQHGEQAAGWPLELAPITAARARITSAAERDLARLKAANPDLEGARLRPVVRPVAAWAVEVRRREP